MLVSEKFNSDSCRTFLTPAEVASLYGTGYRSVLRWCKEGRIPFVQYGRKVLIPQGFILKQIYQEKT